MEPKKRNVEKEGVHLVIDENGDWIAAMRRDPISKKHLVYLVKEATSEDIADLIK